MRAACHLLIALRFATYIFANCRSEINGKEDAKERERKGGGMRTKRVREPTRRGQTARERTQERTAGAPRSTKQS